MNKLSEETMQHRQDFVFLLRSGFYRQGTGWGGSGTPGADHCALSVCNELVRAELNFSYVQQYEYLGLTCSQGREIFKRNDGWMGLPKQTLTEIADWFEKEFIIPFVMTKKEGTCHTSNKTTEKCYKKVGC